MEFIDRKFSKEIQKEQNLPHWMKNFNRSERNYSSIIKVYIFS